MELHPSTPAIAIICITTYGIVLAVLGINSTVTVLVVASISALGGYGVKDLKEWLKRNPNFLQQSKD